MLLFSRFSFQMPRFGLPLRFGCFRVWFVSAFWFCLRVLICLRVRFVAVFWFIFALWLSPRFDLTPCFDYHVGAQTVSFGKHSRPSDTVLRVLLFFS